MAKNKYYTTKESVKLIKAPPMMPPITRCELSDGNHANSSFSNSLFNFATRYHYDDGEISALSQYSEVAFESTSSSRDAKTPHIITMYQNLNEEITVEIKNVSTGVSKKSTMPRQSPISNLINISFDFARLSDDTFIVYVATTYPSVSVSGTTLFRFNINEDAVISNMEETVSADFFVDARVDVVVNPSDSNEAYYTYIRTNGDNKGGSLILENHAKRQIKKLTGNRDIRSCSPLAISENGDYMYLAYNDDVYKTRDGVKFSAILRIDGNSDYSAGSDIYSQGDAMAICCDKTGRYIYVIVAEKGNHGKFKVVHSNDYGSSWNKSSEIVSDDLKRIIIKTNDDGSNVVVSYVVSNKSIKTIHSKDYGVTFSTPHTYADKSKFNDILDVSLASNGNALYLSFIDTNNKGRVIKSVSPILGDVFTDESTTQKDIEGEMFSGITDEVTESGNDNRFIENDIYKVIINTNRVDISQHVKKIEIIATNVNTDISYIIDEKKPIEIRSTEFFNDSVYKVLPAKDKNKLYDNVPIKARGLSITQNSLIFGGYTDGHSVKVTTDVNGEYISSNINNNIAKSLKHGTTQSYAIAYYDNFGRSSDAVPVCDVIIPPISKVGNNVNAHVVLTINHKAPYWAKYYCILRKPILLNYETIKGFDKAIVYDGDSIYLDYSSYGDLNITDQGSVEIAVKKTGLHPTEIMKFKIDKVVNVSENQVGSDGTSIILPKGSYVVIDKPDVEHYGKTDIAGFLEGVIYIHKSLDFKYDKIYQETQYKFPVEKGMHRGNRSVQNHSNGARVNMSIPIYNRASPLEQIFGLSLSVGDGGDYDVVIPKDNQYEIYRLDKANKLLTLGRPNIDSENFEQKDRYASLCASEVYVDDTNFNGLSSFNLGLSNYKDLDKYDGEIKLIDTEDTDVEVYQEDRVSKVMYKKDILSMADGKQAISTTQDIWGKQQKFVSEYGISHPHSFAKWGNNKYFVDAKRGVVLRKASNGIFPISSYGMTGYFHDHLGSIKDKKIHGYYEPKYNTYHVCSEDNNLAFNEKNNGWEYRCSLFPDIILNDDSFVYSFKNNILYKQDAGLPNNFYGVSYNAKIQTLVNDKPDIAKVFNAIMINGDKPLKIDFKVKDNSSSIIEPMFEYHGLSYASCIPMGVNYELAPRKIIGTVSSITTASNTIPLTFVDNDIHIGDEILKYDSGTSNMIKLGVCRLVNVDNIQIDSSVSLAIDDVILALDTLAINGDNLRDRKIMIDIDYKKGEPFSLESIVLDVDYQQN